MRQKYKLGKIPKDIKYTPEYGWVKLLPCGMYDTVYRIEYEYVSPISWENKELKVGKRIYSALVLEKEMRRKEVVSAEVIGVKMHEGYYSLIGRSVWLSESDARKALRDWLGKLKR